MEPIKSFEEFYELKLNHYMDDLKSQHQRVIYWGVALIFSFLFFIVCTALGLTILGGWTILSGIILLAVCGYNYRIKQEEYQGNFKEQIIRQIIDFIHPGLEYKPNVFINAAYFKSSSLYRYYYQYYDGDDLIEGAYKNVAFKCSELNVSKTRGQSGYGYIFGGLFFTAPINSVFAGGTYIWKRGDEQLPVSIADEHFRLMPMPDTRRIDCRNGEFEKHYSVYTTDISEASALVNDEMMQCIMDFKNQINRSLTVSFVAGRCYVAIPFEERLLEPVSGNPDNKEAIKEYFFTVLLILSIINKLQLYRLQ